MSSYRIAIDRSLCSGFGACADLAPDVFELEGGIASIRVGESDDPAVLDAADACPMGAIGVIKVGRHEPQARRGDQRAEVPARPAPQRA